MGWRARAVSIAIAALASVAGRAVAKAPPTVRLTYERSPTAADCPEKEAVLDAVRARLGFDPFREPAEIAIRASVTRSDDELSATLLLSDGGSAKGERLLVSRRADCSELASAMELALSIAIDPLSVSREPTAPSGPGPAPAQVTVLITAPAPPVPVPAAPTAPASPKFLLATGGAVGSVGTTFSPTLGFLAGFGLASERWSVSIEGRADLPASREVDGGRVNLSSLAGTLAPCLHRRPFGGCLLATVLALRGSGHDLAEARQLTTALVALGARVAVEVPSRGSFAVRAHADVLGPLTRTTLKVGGEPVWTSPPLSATLGVAAVINFR
jgi:hypothetical protein